MHNPLTPEREDVFWPAMRPREEAAGRLATGPEDCRRRGSAARGAAPLVGKLA